MFLIRYTTDTVDASYTVLRLTPGPTEVEYPNGREFTELVSKDHAVVIQRPLRDSRKRQWVWKGYYTNVPLYEAQWQTLLGLESRARLNNDLNPLVYVWEDDTEGENPFNLTTDNQDPDFESYDNLVWTQVKIVNVYRKSRKGGGPTRFDDSVVEFFVVDPAWEGC